MAKGNGYLEVIPADSISAYYIDADAGGQPKLIEATAPTAPVYTLVTSTAGPFVSGPESPMMSLSGRIAGTGSIAVNLPFEFPFFDRKYSRMWVNQTGIVTFDMPPNVSGCYDRSALARSTAIAPLWLDLAYGGTAQPNENVYLSTAPDSVTVRWAAETQPYLSSYVTPAPVNFRVTLFKDGRIQTQYGAGNQNLTDTWAFVSAGCAASAPVIGISNGHETYTRMSPYDSAPALENARTMRFDPPFGFTTTPVAIVESPAVGETVKGVLTVKGVAYDDTNFVTRLDVLIDDVMVGQTSPSISRTDFCNGNKVPGCPSIGFQLLFNVDTLNLAPGTHLLKIRATNSRGAVVDFPGAGPLAFTVEAGQSRLPAGAIESPAEGAELSGTTRIKGYAYAKDLRVVSIDIVIDGVSYGPASYNQRRDDVCTSTVISLNCPNVGFTFNLNTRSASPWLSNGAHALQIRVRDELGRFTMFPESPVNITVNNAANQLPAGVVVSPENGATLSGVVTVAGYAWDPDGKVSSVSILLDGTTVATAKYGLPQPEACATLPDVTACPNIGFEGTFDSKRYSNGVHTLGIGVLDDKGGSKVFPAFVRYGMNVVIQN